MKIFLHIFAVSLVCGCVSVDRKALSALSALRTGDDERAVKWSSELAEEGSLSEVLGCVESGRVAFLRGDYEASRGRFIAAVNSAVDRTEASPKLKLSDMFNTALASTITDDRTTKYYLSPYEINMAMEYSILSQLFSGRREDALVDSRLAVYVQDTLANTMGADLAKSAENVTSGAQSVIDGQSAALESMIASTRNSWENPVLWWLTGMLFESDGDIEMAKQSYLKASVIAPSCPYFSKRASDFVNSSKKAKLIILYEQDFVPIRQSVKIPVPVYTGMAIDIPRYPQTDMWIEKVFVSTATKTTAAYPAIDIRSLAARDLKEKLPGIVVRNITRATVQAAAQAAANNSGNGNVQLAVLAVNTILSAVRRADTRSWITLPAVQHVWCDPAMEPGEHEIQINIDGVPVSAKVTLDPFETRVLYVAKTGSVVRGASVSLSKPGGHILDINGKEISK